MGGPLLSLAGGPKLHVPGPVTARQPSGEHHDDYLSEHDDNEMN
jgi:hypothetical protein